MARDAKPQAARFAAACFVAALSAATPARWAAATSTGPQPGMTGVPAAAGVDAEGTCVTCHTSFPLNPDDQGKLELEGLPALYETGKTYTLTLKISHTDPALMRWGFQMTAVAMADMRGAGQWQIIDSSANQIVEGAVAGRSYIEHSYNGTAIGQGGGATWTFNWIAPTSDVGTIGFFAAANASNVDGSNQGDRIFSTSPAALRTVAPRRP